jgi:tyrosyl-tRNA synthetase
VTAQASPPSTDRLEELMHAFEQRAMAFCVAPNVTTEQELDDAMEELRNAFAGGTGEPIRSATWESLVTRLIKDALELGRATAIANHDAGRIKAHEAEVAATRQRLQRMIAPFLHQES